MFITYFYSMAFTNTMTISSNKRKRDEAYTKSHDKYEAANEITHYKIRNQNDSTILAHLKHNYFNLDEETKHSPKHNNNSVVTVFRRQSEQQLKSKFMPVIGHTKSRQHVGAKQNSFLFKSDRRKLRKKAIGKQIHPYKASYVPTTNHTSCAISFDTESLLKARNLLQQMKGYYLFYVNITINGFKNQTIDENFEEKLDQLTHWQYVRKEEKFMVQLPVDFDLLTYNMLVYDHEETTLNIRLVYDSINCTEKQLLSKNESVRSLLWNELFDNNTTYYLCNRVFKPVYGRKILYYLTTIWVGYDLNCSAVSRNGSFISMEIDKDHLPLVAPIFCYILSLQFVWIFVLLDLNDDPEDCTNSTSVRSNIKDDQSAQKSNTDPPNTAKLRPNTDIKGTNTRLTHYTKSDRPYGIKRFIVKLLYAPCCCKKTYSKICLGHTFTCPCKEWSNPINRLTFLMWLFVLLPFGLYRTIFRFNLNKMYNNYHSVVRTSEPMFGRIAKCSECWALALDIIYATLFPMIYVCLAQVLYKMHLKDDLRLCSCSKQKDEDQSLIISNKKIRDRFTFRYFQFCKTLDASCCIDDNGNCNCNCCMCCENSINCLLALMYCFFPIFSFSCYGYKTKDRKCEKLLNFCGFFALYFVCLRPTISTFTFLFRSFTYFVFVALPIRVHILRYTMLIVTTVTYFVKYFHEIVNMNSDILKHIFTCEEKPLLDNTQNNNEASKPIGVKAIEEEMFDYIYERLLFVRSSMHFLYMKMIVIFMYLFITIETFITNQSSLTGSGFKDILEFLLIIIGPYAITLVLKSSKDDFLTEENKTEIEKAHTNFKTLKLEKDEQKPSLSDGILNLTRNLQTKSSTDKNRQKDNESIQLDVLNATENTTLLGNSGSEKRYLTSESTM